MALTREQVERWLATLVPGSASLEQTVAETDARDPFYAYLVKVNEGTKDGVAILRILAGRLRIAELAAEQTAAQAEVDAALARITPR